VEIIDDYTIKCNFSKWDSVTINDFSRSSTMYSPSAFEKKGEEWANYHPVGTGPFKFKAFKRNTYVKYTRNDNYRIKELPYVDGAEILNVPDPMTAIALLKKRDVIALNEVDPVMADELKKTGKYKIDFIPGLSQVIVMNSTDPDSIWHDIKMRAALEHAIDKKKIIGRLGRGFSFPIDEIIRFCSGEPKKEIREYNPEKAKQLMKEAGYPNGVKVNLAVMAETPQDTNIALQAQLAKVGINVEIQKIRGATWNQLSFKPAPGSDLRIELQRGGPNNVLSGVKKVLSSTSLYLPGLKRPEGFDDLLQQALSTTDNNRVNSTLAQMEELAYNSSLTVRKI